jgi:2-keto-myo-inositol isomerase
MCIETSSIEDKISAIAEAGFDSIELWLKDIKDVEETKSMLADFNLRPAETVKLEGWFELDGSLMGVKDSEQEILDECSKRIELTASLGCEYIIALPSRNDRGRFRSFQAGADMYNKILDIGKSFGVCPTIEFVGQSSQINNIQKTLDFMKIVDSDFFKMVVDVFHIWRSGDSIDSFELVPLEKISILHFHDVSSVYSRDQYKDRHRVMPGDGILDLQKFIRIAAEKGFKGDVSLGVYNHDNWTRCPFEVAKEGLLKMKQIIETEIQ